MARLERVSETFVSGSFESDRLLYIRHEASFLSLPSSPPTASSLLLQRTSTTDNIQRLREQEMSSKPIIAVTGATGAQGGSVVRFLLKDGGFQIRALTRNVDSDAAKGERRPCP